MKSLNSLYKIISIVLVAGLFGLAACDSPISSDKNSGEELLNEDASFGHAAKKGENKKIEGQYIVVFNKNVKNAKNSANQMSNSIGGEIKYVYENAIKGFSLTLPEQASPRALEAIQNNPHVDFIEQDSEIFGVESQSNASWGLDRSDQRNLPMDGIYNSSSAGGAVTVYIADSGINYTHQDFEGRASFGFDTFGGDGDDCYGHGTHVAGTVGGNEWGIAKNVNLVSVRVLDCNNSGTVSGVIAGIDWITANAEGPSVVNMSLGGGATTSLDTAVENSIASGITYVVSAGNSNADACNYSPARTPSAITIGATTSSDARASYSNYGSCVDLFAPGSEITSAYIGSNTATTQKSGTSMSAPHVTGTVALYLEVNSTASPADVETFMTSNATQNIVTNSNTDNNHLLYTIFDTSSDDGGSTNSAPSAVFTYSADYLNVQFTDGSSDSDGSIASWSWNFGDGASSTVQNPSHSYSEAGTYTVSLTVTDDAGATDTVSKSLTVEEQITNAAPTAAFSYSADYLNVQFTDGSSDSDGSIASWSWDFGDGASSTAQNTSHSYSQAGTYTVSLTVTDDAGATDTVSKSVTVEEQVTTNSAPVINTFSIDSYKNGPWNKVDVTWAVSDSESDLASVKTEILYGTSVVASKNSSVNGNTASGVHDLKTRKNADSVRITVTDGNGNSTSSTKNLGDSNEGGSDPNSADFELSTNGSKDKGKWVADLSWNGATSTNVDIYRDGNLLITTSNSGSYTDQTNMKGGGSLTYKVCEAGTTACSNESIVYF